MDIEVPLKEYGLTKKEIDVYVALLPLGSVNLQEIAKRVDLPRTTIYNTLNYLSNKGLVSKIIKRGVTYFETVEPKKLLDKIEEKRDLIIAVLPALESLKGITKESSSAEIYAGVKGISTILYDVFNVKQQTCYFGSYSLSLDVLKNLPKHIRNIRLDKRIPAKIIIDPCDEEIFHTNKYKRLTEMRFLKSMKDFPCMIFIYGNKVAMYTLKKDLIGVIIKNEQIVEAMKIIFNSYYKKSKPAKL